MAADGGFTYDGRNSPGVQALQQGATANDTFSYTVRDEDGQTATAQVTVTLAGVNDPPVALPDAVSANSVTPTTIAVLANDDDPDLPGGDVLSVVAVDTAGTRGLVTFTAAVVTFDPDGQFDDLTGNDTATTTFAYTIEDSAGARSSATVTVTVAANQPPIARTDRFSGSAGATVAGNVLEDNGNGPDTDPENTALSVTAENVFSALGAAVTLHADGSFVYDPRAADAIRQLPPGTAADDTFLYTVFDSGGAGATGTVTVTVTGVDDPPVARDDQLEVLADQTLTGNVLADNGAGEDLDPDGDPLSVVGAQFISAQGAAVSLETDGSLLYDPRDASKLVALAAGQTAVDAFSYTVLSGDASADGTVTVTVTGVNDPPRRLVENPVLLVHDTDVQRVAGVDPDVFTATFALQDFFADPDGDALTFAIRSSSVNPATFQDVRTVDGNLEATLIAYRSNQDRTPSAVTVEARDPAGLTVTGVFTLVPVPETTIDAQLVVRSSPTPLTQANGTATLPPSVTEAVVGETLFVEVWLKDRLTSTVTGGAVTNGITGGAFDIHFDPARSQAVDTDADQDGKPDGLHHEGPFSSGQFATGTIDNAAGLVDNFGGGTINPDFGIEPEFVRLGYAEFLVTDAGVQTFALGAGLPVARQSDPADAEVIGNIHPAQIAFGAPQTVHLVRATRFSVVAAGSSLGAALTDGTPQQTDVSDRATVAGTVDVVVDLANPAAIRILNANLDLQSSGNWAPAGRAARPRPTGAFESRWIWKDRNSR